MKMFEKGVNGIMVNLDKVTDIYTHGGVFHTDDVMSTVLLKELRPDVKLHRIFEVPDEARSSSALVYDIGEGEFDHHQENVELDREGNKYSAFGLLWREFGRELLFKRGFKRVEEANDYFIANYANKIDFGDNNGYFKLPHFRENEILTRFRLKWFEGQGNEKWDEAFNKALVQAKIFFDLWIRDTYNATDMRYEEDKMWTEAAEKMDDGVVVLERPIDWRAANLRNTYQNAKIVVMPDSRGGYSVLPVNVTLTKIKESPYLCFVHPSGHMGVAETKDEAIRAAKEIAQEDLAFTTLSFIRPYVKCRYI